jgi:tRNA threonylcarbamoyladenosine biosynthesis protein TsaB
LKGVCGLAIEAATEQFSLAACRGGQQESWEARPARDETQRIYEHAERLLARLGANLADLDFVAFGCGPGSFTGVRVAAAAAQAISFGRGIPVCRVSSLAVLAAGAARELDAEWIATCLDARMERAYVALYQALPGRGVVAAFPDAWIDPADFVMPGSGRFVAVGGGWLAYPDLAARHDHRISGSGPGLLPSAIDLLSIAIADFHAGRTVAPHEALPEYLGQRPAMARPPKAPSGESAGDADAE